MFGVDSYVYIYIYIVAVFTLDVVLSLCLGYLFLAIFDGDLIIVVSFIFLRLLYEELFLFKLIPVSIYGIVDLTFVKPCQIFLKCGHLYFYIYV